MTDMLQAQLSSGRSRVMVGGGESGRGTLAVAQVVSQRGARWEAAGDGERGMEEGMEAWRGSGNSSTTSATAANGVSSAAPANGKNCGLCACR